MVEESKTGPNANNVLFEPAIYAGNDQADDEINDAMGDDETQSATTNPGGGHSKVSGKVIDASLLQAAMIRCCICGVMTKTNAANTCINCLKGQIDITEGIPKSLVLHHCRDCNRY